MDSYVVYVYRRPDRGGRNFAGLVERIGDGERRAFQSEAQLLEYLLTAGSTRNQKPARRKAPKKI